MPDRVRCSECGETFASRGFGSHNAAMHGGDADRQPADADDADAPGVEPDGGDPAEQNGDDDPTTAGAGGPDGGYPDPADALDRAVGSGDDGSDDGADAGEPTTDDAHHEAFEDPDNEVDGDPEAGDVTDEVEDEEEDSRYPYQCGNCGHGLPYLGGEDRDEGGKACPECGERLFWSRVEA